jgi:hypothetical protein
MSALACEAIAGGVWALACLAGSYCLARWWFPRRLGTCIERELKDRPPCAGCGSWRCPKCGNLVLSAMDHGVPCRPPGVS